MKIRCVTGKRVWEVHVLDRRAEVAELIGRGTRNSISSSFIEEHLFPSAGIGVVNKIRGPNDLDYYADQAYQALGRKGWRICVDPSEGRFHLLHLESPRMGLFSFRGVGEGAVATVALHTLIDFGEVGYVSIFTHWLRRVLMEMKVRRRSV